MQKKGQAAMEFLMTYGWAILVVLAAIAALAYFGVLSPDKFLPEKCTLPSGIACLDRVGNATVVTMSVQNSLGFEMQDVYFNLSDTDDTNVDPCVPAKFNLTNGQKTLINCSGSYSGKINKKISVVYTNKDTGLQHDKIGELTLKVG